MGLDLSFPLLFLRFDFPVFDELCVRLVFGVAGRALLGTIESELFPRNSHPVFKERVLPLLLYLADALDCFDSCLHEVPVVSHWYISTLFKLVSGIDGHILPSRPSECFSPLDLPRIPSHLKIPVTFGGAESKNLRVVPDEGTT